MKNENESLKTKIHSFEIFIYFSNCAAEKEKRPPSTSVAARVIYSYLSVYKRFFYFTVNHI